MYITTIDYLTLLSIISRMVNLGLATVYFIYLFIYKLCTQCHIIIAETAQNNNRHWSRIFMESKSSTDQSSRSRIFPTPPPSHFMSSFYRAIPFSAKRGIAIVCRLSVCPSVRPSLTLVDCYHIGWNSSEIISPLVSRGCSLSADPNISGLLQGDQVAHPPVDRKLRPNGYI